MICDDLIEYYHEVKVVLDDDEIAGHQHEVRMMDDGMMEHHLEIKVVVDVFE